MEAAQHSRSRNSNDPYFTKGGGIQKRRIRREPIHELIRVIAENPGLCAAYYTGLLGRKSEQVVSRTLRHLKVKPFQIVKIVDWQAASKYEVHWGYLYYELAERGRTIAEQKQYPLASPRSEENYEHALMIKEGVGSIKIALRARTDIRLVRGPALLESMPKNTRESKHPLRVPCKDDRYFVPDDVLAMERTSDLKRRNIIFEYDTGSEPADAGDPHRAAPNNKMRDYIYMLRNEIELSHFGFKSVFVAFITTTTARKESFKRILARMTEDEPELRSYFLFKTHACHSSVDYQPRATGHMLDEPFDRVGYPTFYLDK